MNGLLLLGFVALAASAKLPSSSRPSYNYNGPSNGLGLPHGQFGGSQAGGHGGRPGQSGGIHGGSGSASGHFGGSSSSFGGAGSASNSFGVSGGRPNGQSYGGSYGPTSAEKELAILAESIPGGGVPGDDYPVLSEIPETNFMCEDQHVSGYYADTSDEAGCQVFHICQLRESGLVQKDSFLCPKGTIFNQRYLVCDWWYNFECDTAEDLYAINEQIGQVDVEFNPSRIEGQSNGNGHNHFASGSSHAGVGVGSGQHGQNGGGHSNGQNNFQNAGGHSNGNNKFQNGGGHSNGHNNFQNGGGHSNGHNKFQNGGGHGQNSGSSFQSGGHFNNGGGGSSFHGQQNGGASSLTSSASTQSGVGPSQLYNTPSQTSGSNQSGFQGNQSSGFGGGNGRGQGSHHGSASQQVSQVRPFGGNGRPSAPSSLYGPPSF